MLDFPGNNIEKMNFVAEVIPDIRGLVLVRLARQIIADKLQLPVENVSQEELGDEAFTASRGVFVTLHKAGELRGCIGSLTGSEPILAGVRRFALCAAFEDNRFSPLRSDEFELIDIEVSVLTKPSVLNYGDGNELVAMLRPDVDGVIVRKGFSSATFLPQVWKQLPDPENFLLHLCLKAGLPGDSWRAGGIEVSTYQVQYFSEKK